MKVIFIVNPASGFTGFHKKVLKAVGHVAELGCTVKMVETTGAGDATRLAQEGAAEGFDVAVAVGGDGTINEVVNGLVGTETALAVLPAGTANVYAADIGVPISWLLNPDAVTSAAAIVVNGQQRWIDVGLLTLADGTSRYFLMWCGVGLDAAISQAKKSNSAARRSWGYMAWAVSTARLLFDFRGIAAKVEMDEQEVEERIIVAVVSNGQLYGRIWRMAPEAKMDDGLLDVGIMAGHRWGEIFRHAITLTLGQHLYDPNFQLHRTTRLALSTYYPMPVHVDGETIGTTPIEVEVIPSALKVVVPQDVPSRLFRHGYAPKQRNLLAGFKWPLRRGKK